MLQEFLLKKKTDFPEGPVQLQDLVLHPHHIDDLMLWKAFRSGDEKAFITIFERLSKPLYNYGYKILSEREIVKDGIQELFIEIWQNRARLGETDSIKLYLFKALRRKLIKVKGKSQKRILRHFSFHDSEEVTPSQEFVMVNEQLSLEKKEKVSAMLKKLTKRQHEAIFLRYFEELNSDQIALVMGLSKQAVYNLIHHALEQLKKSIEC